MNQQIKEQEALERHQVICQREFLRKKLLLENIADLHKMYEEKGYKIVLSSEENPSWKMYLGQLEIYYTRSKVERWRKIYQKFVVDLGLNIGEFLHIQDVRLRDMLTLVNTPEDAREWITKAETLMTRDWNDEVREAKGLSTTDDCKHEKMEVFRICSKCGFKHKEHIKFEEHECKHEEV